VACQMIHATINTVTVDFACGEGNRFRATGSTVIHPGFMAVYLEGKDDAPSEEDERYLPALKEGQTVELEDIVTSQHFTEPPPRYSEASLVKTLEEYGIGRPSTYASIISTLQQRQYVTLESKRFKPTDVGRIVNKFLTDHFTQYVDYHFTANLEDDLDAVSRGERNWVPLMREFWEPFKSLIEVKDEHVRRSDVTHETLDEACPECGGQLAIRLGRNGRFIGCNNYPSCKYTRNLQGEERSPSAPEVIEGRTCPKCDSPLIAKEGRYGKFIGCSGYPKCKHIEPLEKPADTGVQCPQCHAGTLIERKSRFGKLFYSCSTYPTCTYAAWNPPLAEPCPSCGWPIVTIKTSKRRGTEKVCPQKGCGYATPCGEEVVTDSAA
jgi:DNA topoisomerase-1